MITQKDKAEQFKRDLRSRQFYEGMVREYDLKLEEISIHLQGVGSPRTDVVRKTSKTILFIGLWRKKPVSKSEGTIVIGLLGWMKHWQNWKMKSGI